MKRIIFTLTTLCMGTTALLAQSGNVGIGTNDPQTRLHVEGTETRLSNNTSAWGLTPTTGGTTGSSNSFEVVDRVNNIRRMVFNDNGNVSLGGTVANNAAAGSLNIRSGNVGIGTGAPATRFHVEGAETRFSNGTSAWGISPTAGPSTFSSLEIVDRVNNIRRMVFNSNGDVTIGGSIVNNGAASVINIRTSPAQRVGINNGSPAYALDVSGDINASGTVRANGVALTSDARLKRNVNNTTLGLKEVMALRPVEYEKKNSIKDSNYDRNEIGFIAQEVAEVIPSLVSPGMDTEKTLSIAYIELIPVLTKAIQEQQVIMGTQQKEIEQLKSQVATAMQQVCEREASYAELAQQVKDLQQITGIKDNSKVVVK